MDDPLDLSQFDAERVALDLEPIDLMLLADGVVERAIASSQRPRVTLIASPSVVVMADAARIERVLANLLVNALNYTMAHSSIYIVVEAYPDRARVSVSDEGPGISPEDASFVFQKFRRAPTSQGRDGYGLGLDVSRKIIEAHGGRIGLDSRPGDGSQFYFELPRIQPNMTAW
ncbi:MAG: HAMP domain-containing sensor histidine kinase [Kofleriaceae bacterium]|nr:HAMP domain-containing sensor histidine kinase [Kofleriaceae bacterium]